MLETIIVSKDIFARVQNALFREIKLKALCSRLPKISHAWTTKKDPFPKVDNHGLIFIYSTIFPDILYHSKKCFQFIQLNAIAR